MLGDVSISLTTTSLPKTGGQTTYETLHSKPSGNAGGIRSWKAARSVNPRWTNLILYGINGDTKTRP
jgi:hypothetical protein